MTLPHNINELLHVSSRVADQTYKHARQHTHIDLYTVHYSPEKELMRHAAECRRYALNQYNQIIND